MKTLHERLTSPLSGRDMRIIIGASVCFCIAAVAHTTLFMLYAGMLGLMIIFCPEDKDRAIYFCRVLLSSILCGIPASAFALWIAFPELWLKKLSASVVSGGGLFLVALGLGLLYRFIEQWWDHRFDKEPHHFHL